MIQFQLDIIRSPSGFFKLCETVLILTYFPFLVPRRNPSYAYVWLRKAITIIILSIGEGIKDFEYGGENNTFFCGGVFIMSMVVTPLMFYTFFRGYSTDIQKTPLELHINVFLTISMLTAGGLIIHAYCTSPLNDKSFADAGKTVGSFGVINGMFYGADTFYSYQAYKAREHEGH